MSNNLIYMSSPDVGAAEAAAVMEALRSGWVAPLGPAVDGFEDDMTERLGVQHAVALSSGTAALHLALVSIGVGEGDLVLTSSMTFAATANAIMYTGAKPFFIDSDRITGNISIPLLERALALLATEGRRPAAIVPVDLLGKAADYTEILRVAGDIPVIADAAESLGAQHAGKPAGSWGTASILSFNGNKIMTTSGGGMLLTDDAAVAARVRHLATQAREPAVHYEHREVGYNYRMSNLLAALGRAQLSRLDEMIARRRSLREMYRTVFRSAEGVEIFGGLDDGDDNCWLTAITVDPERAGWRASDLASHLREAAIECRPLWKPMHLQPVFADARAVVDGTSERLFRDGVTLPSGSALDEAQIRRVSDALHTFLNDRA